MSFDGIHSDLPPGSRPVATGAPVRPPRELSEAREATPAVPDSSGFRRIEIKPRVSHPLLTRTSRIWGPLALAAPFLTGCGTAGNIIGGGLLTVLACVSLLLAEKRRRYLKGEFDKPELYSVRDALRWVNTRVEATPPLLEVSSSADLSPECVELVNRSVWYTESAPAYADIAEPALLENYLEARGNERQTRIMRALRRGDYDSLQTIDIPRLFGDNGGLAVSDEARAVDALIHSYIARRMIAGYAREYRKAIAGKGRNGKSIEQRQQKDVDQAVMLQTILSHINTARFQLTAGLKDQTVDALQRSNIATLRLHVDSLHRTASGLWETTIPPRINGDGVMTKPPLPMSTWKFETAAVTLKLLRPR